MEGLLTVTASSYCLLASLFLALLAVIIRRPKGPQEAPGPWAWPIIGSLHLLAGYTVPYQAFSALASTYGLVFKMQLGSVPCMVINGLENIKEVLVTKGPHFDGRPNFRRYHLLFCGNKENSLAFCDWSETQKTRRDLLQAHTFPRSFTTRFRELDGFLLNECSSLVKELASTNGQPTSVKPMLLYSCANIFTSYFCSRSFKRDNTEFTKMINDFDEIFYEVNQGYAADFIPWLMPLHKKNMAKLAEWSHNIRNFMLESAINGRIEEWKQNPQKQARDYVDCLIEHVNSKKQPAMSWDTALFSLEDIIGGHSAVGNLLVKILAFIVNRPDVQEKVYEEVTSVMSTVQIEDELVGLTERTAMPYTEAMILEVIRLIASPIVPHVANQQTTVAGYTVEKGTLIFLNNHDLSMNPALWDQPDKFNPDRFISPEGHLLKPDHFLPFGGGRRSCMGYKMVQLICFSTLANILHRFRVAPVEGVDYTVPIGNLALPHNTFQFRFIKRT